MITLSDFLSSTLTEIVNGVIRAQKAVQVNGARINPKQAIIGREILESTLHDKETNAIADMVEFDLCVTLENEKGKKGTIGVVISSIGLGAQGHDKSKNIEQNRIKFRIPLELPLSE